MELESLFVNRAEKATRFIVWNQGKPFGYVDIPWARDELWREYSVWNDKNVERSMTGQVREDKAVARAAVALFHNVDFVDYMDALNKPKKTDVGGAVAIFGNPMWPTRTSDRVVQFIHTVLYAYGRLERKFERLFGIAAPEGLARIAKKCYEE